MTTVLDPAAGVKPLDFGAEGVTGSLDLDGRLIALSCYHAEAGYVTLTAADAFPEDRRYDPAAVRAYRAGLARLAGFGPRFPSAVKERRTTLLADAIPEVHLHFADGSRATATTIAYGGGAIQFWELEQAAVPVWGGQVSVQRCAYTQLTEGGPLPPVPVVTNVMLNESGLVTIENPGLPWAAAIIGLPVSKTVTFQATGPISLELPGVNRNTTLIFAFGPNAIAAAERAFQLAEKATHSRLSNTIAAWERAWEGVPADLLVRRGLLYSKMMVVPVNEGACLLTDHVLLPLSWNRDAYYMARALLKWGPDHADLVRQHLLWLFEIAERDAGLWGRAYLANGRIKDRAFQLDQQVYPLLELADYFAATGDTATLARLQHHIAAVVEALLAKRAHFDWLFATDETPADDPATYPYHLSSHILLWHTLRQVATLGPHLGVDLAALTEFAAAVHEATQRTFHGQRGGIDCYAYAADGYGHAGFYHDANDFPLALAPTWGFVPASDPTWRATVDFAFSTANPSGFYSGHLGSVHTPAPWPLGDIQELHIARLLGDTNRVARVRAHLQKAAQWDGALPEAYAAETYSVLSRHWFAWPGAAYAWLELEA